MKDHFQQHSDHSQYWANKASDLHAAAAAVWFSMDKDLDCIIVERAQLGGCFRMSAAVYPVYEMLCGMALELIFKSISVERKLKVDQTHHDLLIHAGNAGITLPQTDKDLLKYLSHSVIWSGRYPVPKRKEKMDEWKKLYYDIHFEPGTFRNTGVKCLTPTEALNWKDFDRLWMFCRQQFVELKHNNCSI